MNKLKMLSAALALAATAAAVAPASAASRTVTLSVPGMTCATCPITVKKALTKVAGVSKVEVAYEQRTATVTFDDAKSSVPALTHATANAGYPATPRK